MSLITCTQRSDNESEESTMHRNQLESHTIEPKHEACEFYYGLTVRSIAYNYVVMAQSQDGGLQQPFGLSMFCQTKK